MASTVTCTVNFVLFRVLLPLILIAAWLFRYNAFSLIYLIFMATSPLFVVPDLRSMAGRTGHYLKALITISSLITLAQAVFHFTLLGLGPDSDMADMFTNCTSEETLARQIGLQRLDNVPFSVYVAAKFIPDVIVLVFSVLIYVVCRVLINRDAKRESELPSDAPKPTPSPCQSERFSEISAIGGDVLLVLFLALSGIVVPSAISAVYFLAFLIVATCWALKVHGGTPFQYIKAILLVYSISHLIILYLYQLEFFQEAVPHLDFAARLTGLTAIISSNCTDPITLTLQSDAPIPWPYYANPAIIICLVWTLACHIRRWVCGQDSYNLLEEDASKDKTKSKRRHDPNSDEKQVLPEEAAPQNESLVASVEGATNYNSIEQDGGAAVTTPINADTPDGFDVGPRDICDGETAPKSPFAMFFDYCMKQSFLLALIAMMAWSITFISWLTFVLLLIACLVWCTPNSRKICYVISPFLVFYAECLLVAQFIYAFDLSELPETTLGYDIGEIGLKKFPYPCLQLGLQIIFTCCLWLTLRQFMSQRSPCQDDPAFPLQPLNNQGTGSDTSLSPAFGVVFRSLQEEPYENYPKIIGHYVWKVMCKYWIFVCCGMTLLISVQSVVIYRLIYMAFLLYFIFIFQVWNWWWRKTMYIFWWVVIVYSMVILVTLYTYQFEIFRVWWINGTGWTEDTLTDIGLEQFSSAGLFVKLLTPTSFIIVVIIQVHYFHTDFLRLSDGSRFRKELPPTDDTMDETKDPDENDGNENHPAKPTNSLKQVISLCRKIIEKCSHYWKYISQLIWVQLEMHILKLVVLTIFIICCAEVTAVSAVYVILIGALLPIWKLHPLFSHLAQFWTAIVLLAKMAYQLKMVDTDQWKSNCTKENSTDFMDSPFDGTIDNAKYVGLVKADHICWYIKNYLGIMLILVLEAIVKLHENQKYSDPQKDRPMHGITFPEVTRKQADAGILSCFKYFVNYLFYKYGLEMCYVMFAIAICVRVDAFAVLYALMLGILLCLGRRGNAYVWPVYVILLAILVPLQYLSVVGLPRGICTEYPWVSTTFVQNLESWLFLPDYTHPPNPYKLIADLFLLLGVCLQARVFLTEMGTDMETYGGGDNKSIVPEVEANAENPVPDYTLKNGTTLDGIKYFMFCYMFWVTMAILFITGTSRINLFSMGYVIASFLYMWMGQEFLLKPIKRIKRMWNFLIGYCFFVLFAKACLQLVGCVYIQVLFDKCCWLVQLFGITCLTPHASFAEATVSDTCHVDRDDTGMAWDVVCFVFLLLQKRIYMSHYFRHMVTDLQAQTALASRGAVLINRILIRRSHKLHEEEEKVLSGIKSKMKMIKERQARNKKGYVESEDHFQVIRSGDYYMFEDLDEDAAPEEERDPNTITFGTTSDHDDDPDPLKLISTAIESGTKKAVDQVESPDDDSYNTALALMSTAIESGTKKAVDQVESPDDDSYNTALAAIQEFLSTAIESGTKKAVDQVESPDDDSYNTAQAATQSEMTSPGSESDTDKTIVDKDKVEEPERQPTIYDKIKTLCKFLVRLLTTFIDWLISVFNEISRHYRYVGHKLQEDKEREKAKIKAEQKRVIASDEEAGIAGPSGAGDADNKEELVEVKIETIEPVACTSLVRCDSVDSLDKFDETDEDTPQKSRLYRAVQATYYVMISRSEILCYFLMILNVLLYGSVLSIPLAILVFLWAMLSVPRPSKCFWITVITYTEVIVVIKYLFQFEFFSWNQGVPRTDPLWFPRILGIIQRSQYANVDIALLLALFIHRSILKRYGLWRDAYDLSKDVKKAECEDNEGKQPSIESAEDGQPSLETGHIQVEVVDSGDGCAKDSPVKRKRRVGSLLDPFKNFYDQMTDPTFSATTDVYTLMLLCDIINFVILVLGYSYFGPAMSSSGSVSSYLSDNRIPVPFLLMLLSQFFMIIIDRGLYLKKNVLGKFVWQIILVVLIHVLMFFLLPKVTNRSFISNNPAKLFYFIKCIYFGLSAYQIRSGYPTRILGNFLTKKYNYLNLFLFKGFLAIPFILEIRSLMDWMWTDTTLSMGSWLQMEDIYANIFVLKCWRRAEDTYPVQRGNRKRPLIKYIVGGLLLLIIILIIWFPLVLFSFANTVYIANPPAQCKITIAISGYDPIFSVSAQRDVITALSPEEYDKFKSRFNQTSMVSYVNLFKPEDITKITIRGQSTEVWGISPPSLLELQKNLNGSGKMRLEVIMAYSRENVTGDVSETISGIFYSPLERSAKQDLLNVLQNLKTNESQPVTLTDVYPPYIRLRKSGKPEEISELSEHKKEDIQADLAKGSIPGLSGGSAWWELKTPNGDKGRNGSDIIFYTFNDRIAPSALSIIAGYGIIGLYMGFILLIGRILRGASTGMHISIMWKWLPFVDRIYQLTLDIYLIREMREYRLEEELFAKLIYLYRSPEMMFKYTKMPRSMIKTKID